MRSTATSMMAKVKKKRAGHNSANLIEVVLDNTKTHVMIFDRDLNIIYVKRASLKTLTAAGREIQKEIRSFLVNKAVGSPIDTHYQHPKRRRRLLSDPSDQSYTTHIQIGPLKLLLKGRAIVNKGEYAGNIVEWEEVRDECHIRIDPVLI